VGAAPWGALLPWRLAGRAEDEILAMVTLHYLFDDSGVCNGKKVGPLWSVQEKVRVRVRA